MARWGIALFVFLVIGLGSTVMAIVSISNQNRNDEQRFDEEAQLVEDVVEAEIESAFTGIGQVAHYLSQTLDTASPRDFSDYMNGSKFTDTYPALRAGVLVVELVPADEVDALIERERRYNPDFEVTPLVSGFDSPTLWVVTRATNQDLFGDDLFGADISQVGLALPGYLPSEDQPTSILPLSAFGALAGSADDPAWNGLVNQAAAGEFQQIVLRWIPGENGRPAGLIFASLNDETLVDKLAPSLPAHLNVRLQLLTEGAEARPVPAADRSSNSRHVSKVIEGTKWDITIWAGDGFASTSPGLIYGLAVVGWILAIIVAFTLLLLNRGLGELEDVQLELQETSERVGSDSLTGLINRSAMMGHLQDAVDSGESVAVLFLDMDRFKLVNDTLGHDAGDDLLRAVAERISSTVRSTDWVARFGGDEFVVLLPGVKTLAEAMATAQSIQERLQESILLGNTTFYPAASIGVAIASDSMFVTPSELLRQADTAMYAAKRSQLSGIEIFDASMREAAVDRLALEQDLHQAVSGDQLVCHYQAIVDASGEVAAYESIIRWHHPARGLVDAKEFQDVARQSGLIGQMTRHALAIVCIQMNRFPERLPIHMNIDAHVLGDPGFGTQVQVILTENGIKPERLVLEVTEEGLGQASNEVAATIDYLNSYGVRFAVDDFGKGQTSLSLLTRFAGLSMVKLDRDMVRDIDKSTLGFPVIKAIVSVAQSMDLVVAAEGVTNEDERRTILGLGVANTQGPLHGQPLPVDEVAHLIA